MSGPINVDALVASLSTQPRGDKELLANNVVMSLAAQILKAQFGEELAFPGKPGSAAISEDTGTANADYNTETGNIRVNPRANGNNRTMYMKKLKDGSYIGDFYGNPTTEHVLNMVNTLRHELTHARTNTGGSIVKSYPTANLAKYLPENTKSYELSESISKRNLPSVDSTYPLDEFLATAIPLSTAEQKLGPLTSKQAGYKKEIDDILFKFPGIAKLIKDMSRPELFTGK